MLDHTATDIELIDGIKQDNKTAFRLLFDRHYRAILATAVNLLKDISSAKDVTQEVFAQIWKKRATIHINSSVGNYLKRAVINRSLNLIKAQKLIAHEEQMTEIQSDEPSINDQLAAQDLEAALNKALDTLPERCRLIFVMRRLEGISLKEIAEKLEISPKTVENQITKALKVLKTAIQPMVKEDSS